MNDVSILRIGLRHDDGTWQELSIDAASALVGSGSHCEVRLPSEDAAVEQLRLTVDPAGVFAQVRSMDRMVTLNGVPFVEGRVLPDGVLRVGRATLLVSAVGAGTTRDTGGTKQAARRSPGIYGLAVIGFPLGFYLLLSHRPAGSALPKEVEPPPLFAAASSAVCPESLPESALAEADEQRRRAEIARERAPFSGQDAVSAVDAFERAASCFRSARVPELAEESQRQAQQLASGVERDFHVHRVRLERALATKDYEEARTEVRLLLSYLGRHSGPYTSWLLSLDRQIELKFSGKKRT